MLCIRLNVYLHHPVQQGGLCQVPLQLPKCSHEHAARNFDFLYAGNKRLRSGAHRSTSLTIAPQGGLELVCLGDKIAYSIGVIISRITVDTLYTGSAHDNLLVAVRCLRHNRIALYVGACVQVIQHCCRERIVKPVCSPCDNALMSLKCTEQRC